MPPIILIYLSVTLLAVLGLRQVMPDASLAYSLLTDALC